jgi:murein DD-endopeptidase MepM/ murein hydrolase activator NlpD/beta-lactamase regulating signal transducer with metallopeptidase domain
MMADLARSPALLALGAALLHSVWEVAAVAAALAVLLRVLAGASASARYLAACGALVLAAALPVATFFHLLPSAPAGVSEAPVVLLSTAQIAIAPAAAALPPPSPLARALAGLSLAWAAGALVMMGRLSLGLARVRRLVRERTEPLPAEWEERFAALSRRLGLARVPRLLGSVRVDVPMAIGFLRPVVIVPISILGALPPASVEALLAHELAHLRRLDFAVNLALSAVEAALFYHPAAHFIARCVRTEREHAADDLAAPLFGQRRYATALFELESSRDRAPEPALGSNGGSLMVRIERLLAPRPARPRAALWPALLGVTALGLSAVWLGSCGRAPEVDTARSAAEAQAEVHIRWLPPALEPYRAVFEGAAARHGVDADTLAIVAMVESSGDPAAESPAGAVGLMQLMPRTAEQIAVERGLADFGQERLRDPEYNVDLGAWYFARQLAGFQGGGERRAVELASAAYNAGPGAVRAYLAGAKPLPEETERYKALVTGMWSEREEAESPTFAAWRQRIRERAAARAHAPLAGGRVTLAYGASWEGAAHEGIDIGSAEGTRVAAPLDGVVVQAGDVGDQGRVVVIKHAGGIETRYHHLGSIEVEEGQRVARDDVIGTVGSTGKSTGAHMHFEVRDLGAPIDPTAYVGAR